MPDLGTALEERRRGDSAPAGWLRPLLAALAPSGARGRLTILIFHRIHAQRDPLFSNELHAATFEERMRWTHRWFNVLPLDEAVAALERGTLPARALAITFDDGYADNVTVALPILESLGLPATFFITTAFLDGGRMWNDTVIEAVRRTGASVLDLADLGMGRHPLGSPADRRTAIGNLLSELKYLPPHERETRVDAIAVRAGAKLPDDLMMTIDQLRSLARAGMGIGAHTVSHPILARLDERAATDEIAGGRDALEGILRQPVSLFAYPNGKPNVDYAMPHVRIAQRLGFVAAFSTAAGAARRGGDPYQLPRFTPWDRTAARWGGRLARNLLLSVETAAA